MPSHFAHLLFADEALTQAFGRNAGELIGPHANLFHFGAQGPDFFYHNQRTMPTGLRYGVALHRHLYGAFVAELAREALRLSAGRGTELFAFTLGFATHAPLDRATHPFIGYFSGWVDPSDETTRRRFHAHPFFERILDVLLLRERFGASIDQLDFLSVVRCGKMLPYPVTKAMVKALNATYPAYNFKSRDRHRVENAYHDTMYFYKLTNHLNPDLHRLTYRKDRNDGFRERRLGLLHPREIPDGYDFLNLKHAAWCHPCDETAVSTASFLDLYEQSLSECSSMLADLHEVLIGKAPLEGLAERVGNQSLDTGREPCAPRFSKPLPLPEILEAIYASMENDVSGVDPTPEELASREASVLAEPD